MLEGSFLSQDGYSTINGVSKMPYVLNIVSDDSSIQYLGYDKGKNNYYLIKIDNEGMLHRVLSLNSESGLKLVLGDEVIFDLKSMNSFFFNGKEYFRQ